MRPPLNQTRPWSPQNRSFVLPPSLEKNNFSHKISRPLSKLKVARNLDDIDILGQVGEGTYGKVFKAIVKSTKELVALKKMVFKEEEKGKDKHKDGFPITSIREIKILRKLSHPNIVELKSMVLLPNIDDPMLYMVFEYIDHDLTGILNHPDIQWEPRHIKCIARQLFEGVEHLHKRNIMHRDMKGNLEI
jgi:CTD kinase subunit alpha